MLCFEEDVPRLWKVSRCMNPQMAVVFANLDNALREVYVVTATFTRHEPSYMLGFAYNTGWWQLLNLPEDTDHIYWAPCIKL